MGSSFSPRGSFWVTLILILIAAALAPPEPCDAGVTREEVERAIRDGVRFLKGQQRDDGSWADVENDARTGVTSMVTLALLTAGEKPDSKAIKNALEYLRGFTPERPAQHLRDLAANDGLRGGRPRQRLGPDRGQRRLASGGPDQAR